MDASFCSVRGLPSIVNTFPSCCVVGSLVAQNVKGCELIAPALRAQSPFFLFYDAEPQTSCAAQEHVTNCRTSAQHAVASILAPDTVGDYDYLPFFYSRVFNLSWQARAYRLCGHAGMC